MSLPRYFEDPQTLHVNTTSHHAYFIPFSSTESAVKKTREFSPYFTLLNGEWDFTYFESYTHLPQDFLHFLFTDKKPSNVNLPVGKPEIASAVANAVGPGTDEVEMELKEGDKVIFSKYAGTTVKYNGEEIMIMDQRDILAVVK